MSKNPYMPGCLPAVTKLNKAKVISAELLELNLKNKLEETGRNGKKW